MNPKATVLLVILIAWSSTAASGIFDDTDDLKGKIILATGDVEELRCPPYGDYECDSWPANLLRFRNDNVCFVSDVLACGMSCTGLLAMGRDEVPYFFAFERLGSDTKKHSAKIVECPSMY